MCVGGCLSSQIGAAVAASVAGRAEAARRVVRGERAAEHMLLLGHRQRAPGRLEKTVGTERAAYSTAEREVLKRKSVYTVPGTSGFLSFLLEYSTVLYYG